MILAYLALAVAVTVAPQPLASPQLLTEASPPPAETSPSPDAPASETSAETEESRITAPLPPAKESTPARSRSEVEWRIWMKARQSEFYQFQALELSFRDDSTKAIKGWRVFLTSMELDNPHTHQDDDLRKQAQDRIAALRRLQQQEAAGELQHGPIASTPGLSDDGRFATDAHGTVIDRQTGLQWAAADNGRDITHGDALNFVGSMELGGHDDWRLPTAQELRALYGTGSGYQQQGVPGSLLLITDSIAISSCCVWAKRVRRGEAASFSFCEGKSGWIPYGLATTLRCLAVREAEGR